MGFVPLEEFRFDAARSREYLVNANWGAVRGQLPGRGSISRSCTRR